MNLSMIQSNHRSSVGKDGFGCVSEDVFQNGEEDVL